MEKQNSRLSHTDAAGKANMVDVGDKNPLDRIARATGSIMLQPATIALIKENQVKKGDVLTIAEIAGIQAAKQTSALIPLCHPLQLTKVEVRAELNETGVTVNTLARCIGQTGVEMEALTAASVALLTIYDMCKAVDHTMIINGVTLIEKTKNQIITT